MIGHQWFEHAVESALTKVLNDDKTNPFIARACGLVFSDPEKSRRHAARPDRVPHYHGEPELEADP
jgi:hypothetical protein